jgi:hypothetical protein
MCAPHGDASPGFLDTMLRLGLEAFLSDLPFPWRAGQPVEGPSLSYWGGVNWVGGLPLIPRYPFTYARDEVVLRAYLDQPLVLYGHHEDVAGGLDVLAEAAELVNGLGSVRWCSAEDIARSNFLTRRSDEMLHVRPLARRIDVEVPGGVARLAVELPKLENAHEEFELVVGDQRVVTSPAEGSSTFEFAVAPGRAPVELRPLRRVDPDVVKAARTKPWPIVRRALTEGRDRLMPFVK